jgi:hypothetical protein
MKHLPELAVRMNYVPIITEHVPYSFLVNCIGRLKVPFGLRVSLRHDDRGEKKRDETVSIGIYDFVSIFE